MSGQLSMVNCTIDFKGILHAIGIHVDILSRIQDHENKNTDCFIEISILLKHRMTKIKKIL